MAFYFAVSPKRCLFVCFFWSVNCFHLGGYKSIYIRKKNKFFMKTNKKYLPVIIVLCIVALVLFLALYRTSHLSSTESYNSNSENTLTVEECASYGGKSENILGSSNKESCGQYAENIGVVTGLLCSCVCCVPTDTSYCTDGIKDGTETDIDCGGYCDPCEEGKNCGESGECLSNFCRENGTCAPDGIVEEECSDQGCFLINENGIRVSE